MPMDCVSSNVASAMLISSYFRLNIIVFASASPKNISNTKDSMRSDTSNKSCLSSTVCKKSTSENLEYRLENYFGSLFPKSLGLSIIFSPLLHVSWKNFQVSQFLAKSSDSQRNFVFLQKQPFFELTPPVDSLLSGYPNTEKRVKKTKCSRVFLTKFKLF